MRMFYSFLQFPNGKQMQENLTGFLEKDAKAFMGELWELLLSAQSEETKIPTKFLEAQMLKVQHHPAVYSQVFSETLVCVADPKR